MTRARASLLLLGGWLVPAMALACPYCMGNGQEGRDSNTTLILSLFILACYVPYWVIWRLIKKGRGPNVPQDAP